MNVPKIDSAEMMNRIERHRAWVAAGEPEAEAGPAQAGRLVLLDSSISPIHVESATLSSAQIIRCSKAQAGARATCAPS